MAPGMFPLLLCLSLPYVAYCCGMTLHSEVAIKTSTLFASDVEGLSEIIAKYPHALVAGAPFPDYMYSCGTDHDAGEDAHWHAFHSKAATYIREKYPNWRSGDEHGAKLVAFMLGAVSHYAADMNWHGQRVKADNVTRGFGLGFLQFLGETDYGCQGSLCEPAHSAGDTGGEFIIHHQLASTFNIEPLSWFIPVEDLVEIFHRPPRSHPNVTSSWITDCALKFRAAVEGVAIGGEAIFSTYAKPAPFLQEQLQDFWIGGFDDMVHFSLISWNKFISWLVNGPPPFPPPLDASNAKKEAFKGSLKRKAYTKLMKAISAYQVSTELKEGANGAVEVLVSAAQKTKTTPRLLASEHRHTDSTESGLYANEGSAVTYCDIDGDGMQELITGAPGFSLPGKPLIGKLFVYKAGKLMQEILPVNMTAGYRFGSALSCNDFDADGFYDLAVSSPTAGMLDQDFERQTYSGRVQVFFGTKTGLRLTAEWQVDADGPADVFGIALLSMSGGRLAVGSPYWRRSDDEQMKPGKVHIFQPKRGERIKADSALQSIDGTQPGELFGHSMCMYDELLLVGAPGHFAPGMNISSGAVYAVNGTQVIGKVWSTVLHGRFGHSCATLSSGKVAVGIPNFSPEELFMDRTFSGAVVLLDALKLGGEFELPTSSLKEALLFPHPFYELDPKWARFGWTLSSDEKGDHLIIGAPFASDERGAAFVYKAPFEKPCAGGAGNEQLGRAGWSLAIDGTTVTVGAPRAGGARGSFYNLQVPQVVVAYV